ncbi:MAG: hypothetical protein JJ895_14325 [Balneolaceae bacterium]|nr:hypothetical protein [Balneolaceae bacterium]
MMTDQTEKYLLFAKKWIITALLFIPTILIIHQFWLAIARNILMAVNYEYPLLFAPMLITLDWVTLFIHEAGHTIFGIFGFRFLAILGGTLLQILIPTLILASAYWNRQKWLMQLSLFWLGFSWLDTAAYCSDAKYQNLPLIGNLPKSAHDFTNMLNQMGLLDYYMAIAWILFSIGVACLLVGLFLPLINIKKPAFVDLSSDLEEAGLDI